MVSDLIYIPARQGWLYLVLTLVVCPARGRLSFMSGRLRDELTQAVLIRMVVHQRRSKGGLLHH